MNTTRFVRQRRVEQCSRDLKLTLLLDLQSLTITDAETLVLKTLKQVMEEKLDHHNVQLAQVRESGYSSRSCTETFWGTQVTPNNGFEILDEVKLKEIIDIM